MMPTADPATSGAPPRGWVRSPFVWLAAVLLLAVVGTVLLTVIDRGDDDADPDDSTTVKVQQTAFAEVLGQPLPAYASPDPGVGRQAPTVSAQTMTGDRVQLQADGTARLYGFFAHWCPHCRAELPVVADWLDNNDLPAGIDVVAVSTAVDENGENYPPTDWFTREGWPGDVLLDDEAGSLASGFGLTGFPYWVAVAADGTVLSRASGELGSEQFATLVDRLAGTQDLSG